MIGSAAILTSLFCLVIVSSFIFVGLVLLLADAASLERATGKKGAAAIIRPMKIMALIFILFPGYGVYFLGARMIEQIEFHNQLTSLPTDQVSEIETPSGVLSNRSDVEKISAAVRQAEWFLRDGALRTTKSAQLTVRLKSQQSLSFRVAYFSNKEGAVIFADDSDTMEFSPNLAKELRNAGLHLQMPGADSN